ncbi:uncharacterized protein LOC131643821 [Vicia villosa]|uniref:uncharacterized protein LOC131643821 n=1 Tax=Vicia villosa TaxID=3911 RepID=UPI00273B876B|nr:uncharacterized protein LOC131643821 [Vicia villosa]
MVQIHNDHSHHYVHSNVSLLEFSLLGVTVKDYSTFEFLFASRYDNPAAPAAPSVRLRKTTSNHFKGIKIHGYVDIYNDPISTSRFFEAQSELNKLLLQEEDYWKQRAKLHWLTEGDRNTRFFHQTATARNKFKHIDMLREEDGMEIRDHEGLCAAAKKYFEELFTASHSNHEPVLSLVQPVVTNEDNSRLLKPISKEELHMALCDMHPNKSPGPDGFNPAFYQNFWEICGDDIWRAASDWLTRGYFPSSITDTNICLIPKGNTPQSMKDYRPISLCNVVYKIVSKTLATRMKFLLDKCVAEEQSAFVEGRSILDNAMVAMEVIHALKRRTKGSKAGLALKIDISKAYDRVDWSFLRGMLVRMGFANEWIHWIMMCVTSVHYTVLVNSDSVGPIEPGRGLRQGDPLSPYLFILITEGLSKLIKHATASGNIHGIQICRGAPPVSHLLFADDCFLFCRANLSEVEEIMKVINIYGMASGQEINLSKSEVFFSNNLSRPAQEDLASIMGVRHVLGTGKYLGLPSLIGRSKKATFSYIKDRIWNRINSWKGRSFSRAGKEVMIKSVLQAIPSYVMSIFILPDTFIKEIEIMLNFFWWGGGNTRGGIRWMAWDRLTRSKKEGGLGFRDFKAFNMAMVAKQGWSLISKPHALASRIIKARYFPNNSFFEANIGYNPSFVWRSIWKSREVLSLGCRWMVGDGRSIAVMNEPWCRGSIHSRLRGPQKQEAYSTTIHDLMLPNVKQWNTEVVSSIFDAVDTDLILQVPLLEDVTEDTLIWKEEQDGKYSVRSGYRLWRMAFHNHENGNVTEDWNSIWNIVAPPKVKHLLWRICSGCLPTRSHLRQRFVMCPLECEFCNHQLEDEWHLFIGCEATNLCWRSSGLSNLIDSRLHIFNNFTALIFDICKKEDKKLAGRFAVMIELMWKNRNDLIWNQEREEASKLGLSAFHRWNDWFHAQEVSGYSVHSQYEVEWRPPPLGWIKCNVDAAFNNNNGTTNRGWCMRNHLGNFISAGTTWDPGTLSVFEAEAFEG